MPAASANVAQLARIIIALADLRTGKTGVAAVKLAWIETQFDAIAADALAGGFQAGQLSDGTGTFAGAWNGASSLDRAAALLDAKESLEAEIIAGAAVPGITYPDYSSTICRV